MGNACTELEAEELSLPALRSALAAGQSRGILIKNTAHFRKGLSQWTKARRGESLPRLGKAAAYMGYCLLLDICRAGRGKG